MIGQNVDCLNLGCFWGFVLLQEEARCPLSEKASVEVNKSSE